MNIQQQSKDTENNNNKHPNNSKYASVYKIQWRLIFAFMCIVGDVTSWIIRAEFVQGVEDTYNKPIFISYVVHSSYLVFFCIWLVLRYLPGRWKYQKKKIIYTWKYYLLISCIFTVIVFCFNYSWYLSLPLTEVAANTAIYEAATAFVFILSVPILGERVTLIKVISLVISIMGVCLISMFPSVATNSTVILANITNLSNISNSSAHPIPTAANPTALGYGLVILSTVLYSLYEVLYKRLATSHKDTAPIMNTVRMLGLIGIWYLILVAPFLIIAHFTGLERFELPSTRVALLILMSSVLDGFSNILILFGIVLSSPLFISMGALLALPASAAADYIFHNIVMNYLSMMGALLIIIGFIGFTFSTYMNGHTKKNQNPNASKWFTFKPGWKVKHYFLLYLVGWYPGTYRDRDREPLVGHLDTTEDD